MVCFVVAVVGAVRLNHVIHLSHGDVMTWKRFPHYWPSPVDSPHEGLVMWSFDFSFDASLIKLMNKQLRSRWTGVSWDSLNTLRPRQNGRHFPDDIFKCIFLNDDVLISITISLKFVPNGPINKIPALVQIMAWRRPGDKLLSEPRMVSLPTHIYVTRPQSVHFTWMWVFMVASLAPPIVLLQHWQSSYHPEG